MKNKKDFIINSITKHGGKMEGIPSISTSREMNDYCKEHRTVSGSICEKCYVSKHEYKSGLMRKLERNHAFYTMEEIEPENVPTINNNYFRFESFADLNNELQYRNYCMIAKQNPGCRFTLWTKNPFIIKKAHIKYGDIKPDNMNIVLSSLMINEIITEEYASDIKKFFPFIDAIFTVYTKEFAEANGIEINCGSKKCLKCLKCYAQHDGIVIINELLK